MSHRASTKALLLQQETTEASVAQQSAFALARQREVVGWWPYSYDASFASVRIRCLHPLSQLRRNGYPVELFNPKNASSYEAVLFSKHLSQKSLLAAQELKQSGVRIIFDLCDNDFHNPMKKSKRQERASRLRQFIEMADKVVVSTEALAEVVLAEAKPSAPVSIIGDAVEQDLERVAVPIWQSWVGSMKVQRWTRRLRAQRRQGRRAVVWFGNGGSTYKGGIRDIAKIRAALEVVNREIPLSLTVVSNNRGTYREVVNGWAVPTQYVEWDLKSSAKIIAEHDVAVIPVVSNPYTICKTNNRLVLALHLGLPVVADSIPSYQAMSEACVLGDWETGLRRYLSDSGLRQRHLAAARAIIDRDWTIETIAAQWATLFDSVLQR